MGYLDNTGFDGFANDPTTLASGTIDSSSPTFGTNPNASQQQPNMKLGQQVNGYTAPQNAGMMGGNNGFVPKNYGQMQGYLLRQENDRANAKMALAQNQDGREERQLGMMEEGFGWKREEYQKEKTLQAGMTAAAQDGGYEAVIKYLEKADPTKAIEFTKQKLSLDKDIMSNDVLKATSKYQIDEAMVNSYGLLGKIGAGIAKMPPEMRQQAYDHVMPMVKKINPNAPTNLKDAIPMFLLSIAQATPANQLFKTGSQVQEAQSTVGKLNADIETAVKRGATVDGDTEADKGLQALLAERQIQTNKLVGFQNKQNAVQVKEEKDVQEATMVASSNLRKASGDFLKYGNSYVGVMGAIQTLEKDPSNSQAQNALAREFVKDYNSGAQSLADEKIPLSAAGFADLAKKVESMMFGQNVTLNAQEIKNLKEIKYATFREKLRAQSNLEADWLAKLSEFGNRVNVKGVQLPSTQFTQYQQELVDQKTAQSGQVPDNMKDWAAKAKARGYSEEEINAKLSSYMDQKAKAGAKQGEVQLTPSDYAGQQ